MSVGRCRLVIPIVAAVLATAFGPGVMLAATSQTPGAPLKPSVVSLSPLHLTAPVPTGWVSQPPASSMRLAQFQVPGGSGHGDAEAIFFYFGQGQGGSVEANTARWQSQFTSPDGKPVKPNVEHLKVSGMPVTTVELTGTYARGMGMGPAGPPQPDQSLLVAVLETAQGNLHIQMHGPRATVAANRDAFLAMVRGIK
jgi:hypothetical protein